MATEFIGQKPPFTALPNWLRGKTTPLELAVMWCLQSHFPNIHPGLNLLAEEAGMAKSTLCSVLSGLERKGWVGRERAFLDNGRSTSTRYRLTIWDAHWQFEAEQSAWSVRETDSTECPGNGQLKVSGRRTGSVRETDRECPGDGQEVDKSKKINSKKALEPPLPPSGGNAPEGQGELITVEALPVDAAVPNTPAGGKVPEPPPPTKPVKARKARFQPSHDLIPAALLPVHPEILGFWATKAGARTQLAWDGLIKQLGLIQQDPQGGTEMVRTQLQTGIDRAPIKPWLSVSYGNWRKFGLPQGSAPSTGNRRMTQTEAAAHAVAFYHAREAKKAAAKAASETQQTLLAEVVG